MTLRERIRDWLGVEERAITPAQLFNTGQWIDLFPTASGQPVNPTTAMQAALGACVRLLSDDISSQPWDVFTKDGKVAVEVEKPRWMVSPTGRITDLFMTYVADWVTSQGTDGNTFTLSLPNVLSPEYVEVLAPDQVEVFQSTRGDRSTIRYRVGGKEYDEMRILHVPWVRLPGELRGISPVQASRESIGLEMAARKWSAAFFRNGGTLGGIISVPGGPETVDAKELAERFEARHTSEKNWWRPAVLTGGGTYSAESAKPAEAELGPLWTHVLEEAMRVYHIPPHLLSVIDTGAAARASVEERGIAYVRHAVRPFVSRFEMAHNIMLPGRYVKANLNALMRGDAKTRAEFYSTMLDAKVMAREEVRDLEDLPWMGELGWLETPNNNGIPERTEAPAPEPAGERTTYIVNDTPEVRVDNVTIGEQAAATMADAATTGIAAGMESFAGELSGRISASEQLVLSTFARGVAALEARLERLEEEKPPEPPENLHVRERDALGRPVLIDVVRGSRIIRRRVSRDETGHVISIVAA